MFRIKSWKIRRWWVTSRYRDRYGAVHTQTRVQEQQQAVYEDVADPSRHLQYQKTVDGVVQYHPNGAVETDYYQQEQQVVSQYAPRPTIQAHQKQITPKVQHVQQQYQVAHPQVQYQRQVAPQRVQRQNQVIPKTQLVQRQTTQRQTTQHQVTYQVQQPQRTLQSKRSAAVVSSSGGYQSTSGWRKGSTVWRQWRSRKWTT